jgi:ribA/ribD-fused uncharacterized protein
MSGNNHGQTERQMTFFFGAESPLSNWHPSAFTVKGVHFPNVEAMFMYAKAMLFGDKDVARQILETSDPRAQKALGRKVQGFDEAVWAERRNNIVFSGCHAKFSQNPSLKQFLLDTGDTELVEASPYDQIWGVGLAATDPKIHDKSLWRGLNLLGEVLMQVRHKLSQPEQTREQLVESLITEQAAVLEQLNSAELRRDQELIERVQKRYSESITKSEKILGAAAFCHEVDIALWWKYICTLPTSDSAVDPLSRTAVLALVDKSK